MNACGQIMSASAQAMGAEKIVCWTRMQAEAGQSLDKIVHRKEQERAAGNGLFFWGVGSAPSTMIRSLCRARVRVPVIFSIMKGKPKAADANPSAVVAWNGYVDREGVEREIPRHVLVTSRRDSAVGEKRVHYALICHSTASLNLQSGKPFNHRRFKNVGPTGGLVGASQVTALIEPLQAVTDAENADYEESLTADLTGSYWVKLTRPSPFSPDLLPSDCADPNAYARAVERIRQPFADRLPAPGFLL